MRALLIQSALSESPDLQPHLRLGALLTHSRIDHGGGVPRDRLIGQLEGEVGKHDGEDDLWTHPQSANQTAKSETGLDSENHSLISSWENLKPL